MVAVDTGREVNRGQLLVVYLLLLYHALLGDCLGKKVPRYGFLFYELILGYHITL